MTKKPRKPKEQYEDDGRTIVDMNVPGMRGYDRSVRRASRAQAKEELQQRIDRGEAMTRRETVRYAFYATLAGLVVFAFIVGGCVLVIFLLTLLMKK